jgi:hypothetical protein
MFVTGDSLSPAITAGEERMETPEDVAVGSHRPPEAQE